MIIKQKKILESIETEFQRHQSLRDDNPNLPEVKQDEETDVDKIIKEELPPSSGDEATPGKEKQPTKRVRKI